MFVFNELSTDARVKRSIEALQTSYRINIYSYGEKIYKNNPVITNFVFGNPKKKMSYFKYILFILPKIIFSRNKIFYGHDYYSLPILYVLTVLKKKSKIIYDAHELLIDCEENRQSFRNNFFLFFEKKVIRKVHCIAASKERASIMKKYYNLDRLPTIVENISLLISGKIDKTTKKKIEIINGMKKKYKILYGYTGALNEERDILNFIDNIVLTKTSAIVIIGNGNQKQKILKKYGNNPQVKVFDTVPYNQLYGLVRLIDIGIIQYPSTDLNNIYCASNKVFEYLSVGKPFIFKKNPTLDDLSNNYSFCAKMDGNLNEIEEGIKKNKRKIENDIEKYLLKNSISEMNKRINEAIESEGSL